MLAHLGHRQHVEGVNPAVGNSCLHRGHLMARESSRQLFAIQTRKIAVEIKHQHGDQHQHTAEQRVEKELDGRILFARSAPNADQEIHRQQHHFPEHVEQEEIQRDENAQHARHEQQEKNAVALHLLVIDQLAIMANKLITAVSTTSGKLIPSKPMK